MATTMDARKRASQYVQQLQDKRRHTRLMDMVKTGSGKYAGRTFSPEQQQKFAQIAQRRLAAGKFVPKGIAKKLPDKTFTTPENKMNQPKPSLGSIEQNAQEIAAKHPAPSSSTSTASGFPEDIKKFQQTPQYAQARLKILQGTANKFRQRAR